MVLEGRTLSSLKSFCLLVGQTGQKINSNDGDSVVFVADHLISLGEKLLKHFCELKLRTCSDVPSSDRVSAGVRHFK